MSNQRGGHRPEPSQREVTATVKWYNPAKGFGFVSMADGSADAFLHASIVEQSGRPQLAEGSLIVCDIALGPRGPQVAVAHLDRRDDGRDRSAEIDGRGTALHAGRRRRGAQGETAGIVVSGERSPKSSACTATPTASPSRAPAATSSG